MSVFHIHKRELPFVQIDKQLVNDTSMSWKAKGIMLYLLSKPDDWKVYESEITNHSTDGIKSVKSGIKELIKLGYIVRYKVRSKNQFAGYNYEVYEQPVKPVNSTVSPFQDNVKRHTTNNDNNSEIDYNEILPYRIIGSGKNSFAVKIPDEEFAEWLARNVEQIHPAT